MAEMEEFDDTKQEKEQPAEFELEESEQLEQLEQTDQEEPKTDNDNDNNNNNNESADATTKKDTDTKRKPRSIGRWYVGETLGKGGYSWVKKGYDKKTSKCVALKFIAKADQSWAEEQTKQVITEIDSLKKFVNPT